MLEVLLFSLNLIQKILHFCLILVWFLKFSQPYSNTLDFSLFFFQYYAVKYDVLKYLIKTEKVLQKSLTLYFLFVVPSLPIFLSESPVFLVWIYRSVQPPQEILLYHKIQNLKSPYKFVWDSLSVGIVDSLYEFYKQRKLSVVEK